MDYDCAGGESEQKCVEVNETLTLNTKIWHSREKSSSEVPLCFLPAANVLSLNYLQTCQNIVEKTKERKISLSLSRTDSAMSNHFLRKNLNNI